MSKFASFVKSFLKAVKREAWTETEGSPIMRVMSVGAVTLFALAGIFLVFVAPVMTYMDATNSDPAMHCDKDQRMVIVHEEVRYAKSDYGMADVAHCVPIRVGE